jgi:hypothetical protein
LRLTFASFSIVLGLVGIFMIGGLYAWIVFGIGVDQQHRAAEHDNITKILSKEVQHTQGISNDNKLLLVNNRAMLNAIYTNVKQSLASEKNLNLTVTNHAILSDTNRIVHLLLLHQNLTKMQANDTNATLLRFDSDADRR